MKPSRIKTLLRWLEIIVNTIFLPVAIVAILLSPIIGIPPSAIQELILAVLVLLAASISLSHFGTLNDIAEQTRQLSEFSNIKLLRSAHEAGVVNLFTREDPEGIQDIVNEIERCKGTLDLCGVALPDMVRDKDFRDAVVTHSREHDIRVLLLDPDCDEAKRRAQLEEPLGRSSIEDIRSTIEWLRLRQAENKRVRAHLYTLPPMLALVLTNQCVFVESYHFGRPEGIEGCIGGHVPMLKIRNQSERGICPPYEFFKAHFEYMWVQTHGLRVNLLIEIMDAKASRYVTMENQMSGDLQMDEWKLSGQGSKKPFLFEQGFVWKKGTRIAIGRGSEGHTRADRHLTSDADFLGNNSILTLANKAGIVVWERGLMSASASSTSSA